MEGRSVCVGVGQLAAEQLIDSPAKSPVLFPAVGRPLLSPVAAEAEFSWRKGKVKLHYSIPFLIGVHTHWLLLLVPAAVLDVLLQEKHSVTS